MVDSAQFAVLESKLAELQHRKQDLQLACGQLLDALRRQQDSLEYSLKRLDDEINQFRAELRTHQ